MVGSMSPEEKELKELASERLEIISELQKTRGWQLFHTVLSQSLVAAEFHLNKAKDPSDAWRFLHEVKTLRDLKSWTDREIKTAKEVLEPPKQ